MSDDALRDAIAEIEAVAEHDRRERRADALERDVETLESTMLGFQIAQMRSVMRALAEDAEVARAVARRRHW